MIVSSTFLAALLTNYKRAFTADFNRAMARMGWKDFSFRMPSNTDTENISWLGTLPDPVDTSKAPIPFNSPKFYEFSIQNKTWQAGFEVARKTIEDEKLGHIAGKITELSANAASHPGKLIWSLFEINPALYDGFALFHAAASIGLSGAINNIVTGTGVTAAAIRTDLATARARMQRFPDDRGNQMGLPVTDIFVPPELVQVMFEALNTDGTLAAAPVIPASGQVSFTRGGYRVNSSPLLTAAGDWYVGHVGEGFMRPFIYQEREVPKLEGITDTGGPMWVIEKKVAYTSYGRYEVAGFDRRLLAKIDN